MTQLADRIVNEQLSVRESETAAATLVTRAGRGNRSTTKQDAPGSDSLSAHLEEVSERLGDRFNTRVKVVLRKTKGTITIDFASMADLNRILEDLDEADES
jgi:ParB family chromosome partitioning protein